MAEPLLPAGRLWRRLRSLLPAGLEPAAIGRAVVARWPQPLLDQHLCLHLQQRWQPQAPASGCWQQQGQRWQACSNGLQWWLSRDGWRLYVRRQR